MPEPLLGYGLDRRVVLDHHLKSNHYPPVSSSWLPVAEAAIEAAVNAVDEWDEDGNITGIRTENLNALLVHPVSKREFTVHEVMDGLHLWPFVTDVLASFPGCLEPKDGE